MRRQAGPPTSAPSRTTAPTPWWMERCCTGVPAALEPVHGGSNGPCVTVCVACAAGESRVDMSSNSCTSEGVPRHVSAHVRQPLH